MCLKNWRTSVRRVFIRGSEMAQLAMSTIWNLVPCCLRPRPAGKKMKSMRLRYPYSLSEKTLTSVTLVMRWISFFLFSNCNL